MYNARTARNTMMGLTSSIGGGGVRTMYISNRKREVLPSPISLYCQVNNIPLVYFVLAYLRIRLATVGTYCICDSSRDVISAPVLWVLLGVYIGVTVVGFCGEIFLALETLDVDYLCHYSASLPIIPSSSYASLVLSKRS